MKPTSLLVAIFLVVAMGPSAYASQCAADLQAIDAALSTNPDNLPQEVLDEAKALRDEGATFCEAGDEAGAAERLGPAKFMLGIIEDQSAPASDTECR